MRNLGRCLALAIASTIMRVVCTRLARNLRFCSSDQRRPAMGSPARLITPSTPSSSPCQLPAKPGSHTAHRVGALPGRAARFRLNNVNIWFCPVSRSTNSEPIKPVAPVMANFMRRPPFSLCIGNSLRFASDERRAYFAASSSPFTASSALNWSLPSLSLTSSSTFFSTSVSFRLQ